jgi:SAM-dependent methyltransferase
MNRLLHVGCGQATKANTIAGLNNDMWQEVRFDIDPGCAPDIIGTIVDMSRVPDASFDAIFSAHNLEHIYAHEVPQAIKEFARVLSDDGFVVLTCPDLQSVCEAVARDKLLDTLYTSPAGPIAPIDALFGLRSAIATGGHYMAHKCGFTYSVLSGLFLNGGFRGVIGGRRAHMFDLWILAFKRPKTKAELAALARQYLP